MRHNMYRRQDQTTQIGYNYRSLIITTGQGNTYTDNVNDQNRFYYNQINFCKPLTSASLERRGGVATSPLLCTVNT